MGEAITGSGAALLQEAKAFWAEEDGIGVVELILILVEKTLAENTYVLCGN